MQVFEEYLVNIWEEAALGPLPDGQEAIALMRLVAQAQTTERQNALIDAFKDMSPEDKKLLAFEMSRTGVADQFYTRARQKKARCSTPIWLVRYGLRDDELMLPRHLRLVSSRCDTILLQFAGGRTSDTHLLLPCFPAQPHSCASANRAEAFDGGMLRLQSHKRFQTSL